MLVLFMGLIGSVEDVCDGTDERRILMYHTSRRIFTERNGVKADRSMHCYCNSGSGIKAIRTRCKKISKRRK